MNTDGWFPDPSRGHELRYFDGARWTNHVSDHGMRSIHQWSPAAVPANPSWDEPTTIRPAEPTQASGQAAYPGQWQQAQPTPSPPPSNPGMSGGQMGILAAVIALVVLVGGGLGIFAIVHDPGPADPRALPSTSPTPSTQRTPDSEPTPSAGPPKVTQTEAPGPVGRPQWKSTVTPVTVKGPHFAPGEPVFTMAFPGWPFAYRVPSTFGCIKGTVEGLPDAKGYACIDETHLNAKHKINIMFRPCPTICTRSEQQSMTKAWFNPGQRPIAFDASTTYVETASNDKGRYELDMSHFFGEKPGGPLQWQVGIYIESPPATKATLQKVINDVRSQTP